MTPDLRARRACAPHAHYAPPPMVHAHARTDTYKSVRACAPCAAPHPRTHQEDM